MTISFDLNGLACAEYFEMGGVKGCFIPEVTNFKYHSGDELSQGGHPSPGFGAH